MPILRYNDMLHRSGVYRRRESICCREDYEVPYRLERPLAFFFFAVSTQLEYTVMGD